MGRADDHDAVDIEALEESVAVGGHTPRVGVAGVGFDEDDRTPHGRHAFDVVEEGAYFVAERCGITRVETAGNRGLSHTKGIVHLYLSSPRPGSSGCVIHTRA